MNRTALACTLTAGAAILVAAAIVAAGPLDPPAGPVTSTHKTLTEVEPRIAINAANTPGDADSVFRITQPGSYYLTGNITGMAGKIGIEVSHPPEDGAGVTIDLMGFEMVGVAGSLDGIRFVPNGRNLTVRNGTIRNWGGDGINSERQVTTFRELHVLLNVGAGIRGGTHCRVVDCTAFGNSGDGIVTSSASTVDGCSSSSNGGRGIVTGLGSTVLSSRVFINSSTGISVGNGSTVAHCSAQNNQSGGGIVTGSDCTVTACTAQNNIAADGINVGAGSTVSGCTANSNSVHGITTASRGHVTGCSASFNGHNGISIIGENAHVVGNACSNNGSVGAGSGIRATASRSRIEGNTLDSNDFGIFLEAPVTGCFVVNNHAVGNGTNYNTPAGGNFIGTIVTSNAAMNAAANALVNISF